MTVPYETARVAVGAAITAGWVGFAVYCLRLWRLA
jgi:hypothetical protein